MTGPGPAEVAGVDNRARVLLILSDDVLSEARVLAGKATVKLKLPVSLQIVLRALIEEGLRRQNDPSLLANIEVQAHTVRRARRLSRLQAKAGAPREPARVSRRK